MKKIALLFAVVSFTACTKNNTVVCDACGLKENTFIIDGTLEYEPPQGDGLGWVLSNGAGGYYPVKTPPKAFQIERLSVHACISQTKDSVCGWGCYPQYEITSISKK